MQNIPHPRAETDLGRQAARIAQYGWLVFPVVPNGKVPAIKNGLLKATRDGDLIERWWRVHADHNIGVRCGAGSGLVVVDTDGDEGAEGLRALEATWGRLPQTLSVRTPGGGRHYYFRWPGVQVHNTVDLQDHHGVDIRGDGGYVLVPPSIGSNGRRYELDDQCAVVDMPVWLLQLLVAGQSSAAAPTDPSVWVAMLRDGIPEGQRNDGLTRWAGLLLRRHDVDVAVELVHGINQFWCRPRLPRGDVDRIIGSVARLELRRRQERGR